MLPFFDEPQVRSALRIQDLIPVMERALIDFSTGRIAQPVRQVLNVEPHSGYFGAMPAAGEDAMGVKLLTFYPGNTAHGLPTHLAIILLFRPETGQALAIMDGRLITEMRTAAVSAAATKAMAAKDSRVLAILGSGAQAHSHVKALQLVRNFQDIRVWSRTPEHAQRFAAEIGARAMSAEDAVQEADVVVTATSSREAVLEGAWLKPGAQVNAIGWSGPKGRELDDEAMQNIIIVDSREAVIRESGDILLSGATIYAELGEVLAGTESVPPGATTIFKSVGLAIEDVTAAKLVYECLSEGF